MICPECKEEFFSAPALSRKDNKTLICPTCGEQQALAAFACYVANKKDTEV